MTRLVAQAGARELFRGCLAHPLTAGDDAALKVIAALAVDLEQGGKGLSRETLFELVGRDAPSISSRLVQTGLAVERASIEWE